MPGKVATKAPRKSQDKPSYLGLLNAIANGEARAGRYFGAWLKLTRDPEVQRVVEIVANREAEHGLAFEKRVIELGFSLRDRPDPEAESKLAFLSDPKKSDLQKLVFLGYGKDRPDPFGTFFDDHSIDPQTGALMGRYLAEERDTIRRLRALTDTLKARKPAKAA
jgi:rubrerythrin